MDRYYEVSEDVIDIFNEIYNKKAFTFDIGFQFIGDSKSKNVISIKTLTKDISFVLKKELKVIINEEMISAYDDESIEILFEQEINKIEVNIDNGAVKLRRTDLNTFSTLVNKYGVEKVSRANQVEVLYNEQRADAQELL